MAAKVRPCIWCIPKITGTRGASGNLFLSLGCSPGLLELENGVLVLSFGRPGVWLSFSLDGGYSWTKPQSIIAGDPEKPMIHSSGYTSLLALGKDSFLLAYDDWQMPNAKGEPCKTILVR